VDRLGCYGNSNDTSPHLDRLAAESVRYTGALSTSSWTLPSHASLFTGKFTRSHGARYDREGPLILTDAIAGKPGWERIRARGLDAGEATLASVLAEAGYDTGAVVAGPWLKRVMGLDTGFGFYSDSGIESVNGRSAESVTDVALRWLAEPREGSFFLFLNYFDPHAPFSPPAEFVREGSAPGGMSPREARRLERYEGEIRYMDHHLGRLLRGLRDLGVYDTSWIFVTADHGEALGEHETRGHGTTLYQEVVRIPLLLKYPRGGEGPSTKGGLVQLVDLLPTILGHLDLALPPGVQGSPLDRVDHPIVAEVYPLFERGTGEVRAYYADGYKFVWRWDGRHELFDLERDPGELDDLSQREPGRATAMRRSLERYLASLPSPPEGGAPRRVDGETQEALRALGYLD
jgi:arylsulfatase A-like enzyme